MRGFCLVFTLVFASLLFAYMLPLAFDFLLFKPNRVSKLNYSDSLKSFIVSEHDGLGYVHKNEASETLSGKSYLVSLPFAFHKYLIREGLFPFDDFKEEGFIEKNSQTLRFKAASYNQKHMKLGVLIDAAPKYLRLEYNDMAFLHEKGLEAKSLNTLQTLDATQAQLDELFKDFAFPIKYFFSNPSLLKPYDGGAFLQDAKDCLHHFRLIDGKLSLRKTPICQELEALFVSEDEHQKYHGYLIANDELSLISMDDYKLIPLKIPSFKPKINELNISITPLSKSAFIYEGLEVRGYLLDDNFQVLRSISHRSRDLNADMKEIKSYIFPFRLLSWPSYYSNLTLGDFSYKALALNLLLAVLLLLLGPRFNAAFASRAFASKTFASRAFADKTLASRAFASRAFASRAFADKTFADKTFASRAFADKTFALGRFALVLVFGVFGFLPALFF